MRFQTGVHRTRVKFQAVSVAGPEVAQQTAERPFFQMHGRFVFEHVRIAFEFLVARVANERPLVEVFGPDVVIQSRPIFGSELALLTFQIVSALGVYRSQMLFQTSGLSGSIVAQLTREFLFAFVYRTHVRF